MTKKQAFALLQKMRNEFDYLELVHYTDTNTWAVSVSELNGKRFDSEDAWANWLEEHRR